MVEPASPTGETIKACNGCDVLIHEAQMLDLYAKMPERLYSFVTKYHVTTEQLAALATEAKTEAARCLSHRSFPSWNRASKISVLFERHWRTPLHPGSAAGRNQLAIFRTVRHRARPRRVLGSHAAVKSALDANLSRPGRFRQFQNTWVWASGDVPK